MIVLLTAVQPAPAPVERAPIEEPAAVARRGLAVAARGDPAIGDVQAAAARCADPSAAEGGLGRGRVAAMLPRVTAEVRFDERSYRVVGLQGTGEVDYARYAPGWYAAVRATWDLGALVAPLHLRVDAKGLLDRARRRDEAVRRATALYYERRRLRLALELAAPAAGAERASAALEIERLAAELDALTGGAFTGALR